MAPTPWRTGFCIWTRHLKRHAKSEHLSVLGFSQLRGISIGRRPNIISTLNPDHIQPTDFRDLSLRKSFTTSFLHTTPSAPELRLTYMAKGDSVKVFTPFPDNARGFLYFHSQPQISSLAGGVRLRITPQASPSSFALGNDLLMPSGIPWEVPMYRIASRKLLLKLREQLLHDRLVTEEQLAQLPKVFQDRPQFYATRILHSGHQSFPVNFERRFSLCLLGAAAPHFALFHPFCDSQGQQKYHPFSGSGLVQFERSTLPAHAGRRVMLLRITQIVRSVIPRDAGYSGRLLPPTEGELLSRSLPGQRVEPWSIDIDLQETARTTFLRALWDLY
ncbi:hypothetical protein C8J57DRAFT_1306752 [Mycena rebaudengoi]|nr:hypothetical protein C8J57DRAFT_1306752 [Mycena rebaudengoi]